MKGRKPNSDSVVPFTGESRVANFDAVAAAKARELKPEGLTFSESAIWDRLAPALCHPTRNRLNDGNVYMFQLLVQTIDRHERLRVAVSDEGEIYESETRNGKQLKSRPEVGQLNETWRQIRGLAGEFGMTPASERAMKNAAQLGFDFEGDDDFD
jgi:phage terminase small subunit